MIQKLSHRTINWLNKSGSLITIIIALIGIVISIFGPDIRDRFFPRNIQIEADAISITEETKINSRQGLTVSYKYLGTDVTNLWRILLRFRHTSGPTLQASALLTKQSTTTSVLPYLPITIDQRWKIRSANINQQSISKKLDPKLTIEPSGQEIQITFVEWRNGESFDVELFVDGQKANLAPLTAMDFNTRRAIPDGDIIFVSSSDTPKSPKLLWVDRLPGMVPDIVRYIFAVASLMVFGGLLAAIYENHKQCSENKAKERWRNTYAKAARDYLGSAAKSSEFTLLILESEKWQISDATFKILFGTDEKEIWSACKKEGIAPPDSIQWFNPNGGPQGYSERFSILFLIIIIMFEGAFLAILF